MRNQPAIKHESDQNIEAARQTIVAPGGKQQLPSTARWWPWQLLTALLSVAVALALFSTPVQAATITIDGACNILDAILAANTDTTSGSCPAGSGADTLILTEHITLTSAYDGTENGLPPITTPITIHGDGYRLARDAGAGQFRLIEVGSSGRLTLDHITLTGGNTANQYGGGALYINETGRLTVTHSTISNNQASGTMMGTGGGISNYAGTVLIVNSTLSGNQAFSGMMMPGQGGAIYTTNFNSSLATVTLIHSTVTGNTAHGGHNPQGGGIYQYDSTLNLSGSLLAGNLLTGSGLSSHYEVANYNGTVNVGDYNLFGYSSAALSSGMTPTGTDIIPTVALTDILTTTLADNGGGTFTHALVEGSPAIDAAGTGGQATDQRDIARPQGSTHDIGAFELEQVAPEAQLNSATTCTLVDAITAANTDTASGDCAAGAGADTITLLRNITLTVANNGDNGLPLISTPITIAGDGYRIGRADAAPAFRILVVDTNGDLTLNEVTISGGLLTGYGQGAGIHSGGKLQINQSTISGNTAGIAGGITASGVTTITNSTISGNNTTAFGAGGIANGGTMTLRNTTVTGNAAANLGGGIENGAAGILNLNRSLIAGNSAGTGREIYNRNIINADAYNIIGYSSSAGTQDFTITGTDIIPSVNIAAILNTTLADNGGGTLTHALPEGSPAIDAAGDSGFATDQRGITRPRGSADDIGAVEFIPPPDARLNGTECYLADAIIAANTDTATGDCVAGTGADTITLLRNITLTVANNSDNGLPIITTPITIAGADYRIVRDNNAAAFRIFNVGSTGNLTLEDLTVSGGMITGLGNGGGIFSEGILQLNRSLIRANQAGVSGGISASGVTTMTNSTISGNSTTAFGAGGIGNYGTMTLRNTTVTGNSAANLGGGIENGDGATLNLDRSLIAGNSAGTGREIYNRSTINADAYNIIGYSSNSGVMNYTVSGTDIVPNVGITAILNQIAGDNGGGTLTHALVENSPAIDAAGDSGFATDQRGIDRPQGLADEIGAYESPTLISMTVAIPDFGPSFDRNLTSYSATVTNTVTTVTISSTVSEPNAFTQVTVTPPGGSANTCTGTPISCPLAVGDNAVKVIVKAKDGTIAKTYTTIVNRAPSDDATLSDLVLGSGILTPTFASNVLSYTAGVTTPLSSVLITPTVNEINATFVVTVTPAGGTPVACTGSPLNCPLAAGDNRIEVTVTAQDGTTSKTYTTTFTRPPATDATLGALVIGTGTLTPTFTSNVLTYTARVSNVVTSLTLTPTVNTGNATTVVTVTPPGGSPIACNTDPIDCPLAVGENIIEVTVTAEDGTTIETYTLIVTREASSDASLAGLAIGTGTLTPTFASNVLSYTASVSNVVTSLTLTPTVSEGNATTVVTVTPPGGSPIACSTDPIDCPLAVGENLIEVTVTAEDGTVQTYTLVVTREGSSDASLGGLEIGTGTLSPAFESGVLSYTASVSNVVTSMTITPTVSEGNATTVVTVTPPGGSPIACSTDPIDCPLAVGDNLIEVTVTAEDGTTMAYTITVTVPATPTPTPTATATNLPPTATSTATPTATNLPPTATSTATATATNLPPTATSTATPTATNLPPTATSTATPTATNLPPTATSTATPTATNLPPTATSTATPTATNLPPTATSTATPTATNLPPTATATPVSIIAVNDAAGTLQGETVAIAPLANDSASAAGTLTISGVTVPTHGAATISNDGQTVRYTPAANFSGLDAFSYTVQHSSGATTTASIAVIVSAKAESAAPDVALVDPETTTTANFKSGPHTATLSVPAGAYTGTLDQTDIFYIAYTAIVTPTAQVWEPPTGQLRFAGLLFTLDAFINDFKLDHYHFPQALTLTLHYADGAEGMNPQSLQLYYWTGEEWSTAGLTFVALDEVNHTITYRVAHFTEFALFGTLNATNLGDDDEPRALRKVYLPNVTR